MGHPIDEMVKHGEFGQQMQLEKFDDEKLERKILSDEKFKLLRAERILKERLASTEIWKVVVITAGVTAAVVQAANTFFGGLQ